MVGNRPGVEHDRIGTSILARDLRRYATPRASARSSFGVGLRRTSRPCFIRHRTRHPVGVTYSRRLAPPSAQSWSLDTQARVEWRSAPWRVSFPSVLPRCRRWYRPRRPPARRLSHSYSGRISVSIALALPPSTFNPR